MKKLPKPKKKIEFVPSLAKQEMTTLVTKLAQGTDWGIPSYEEAQNCIAYVLEEVVSLLEDTRRLRKDFVLGDVRSRFLPLPLMELLKEYTQERISLEEIKKMKGRVVEALDLYLPLAAFADMQPRVNPRYILSIQEKRHHPEITELSPYESYGYGW